MKLSRRGFLLGGTAIVTVAMFPAAAYAYGTPPNTRNTKTRKGLSMALGKKIQGAWKAERAKNPTKPVETKVQFKARARNLATKVNSTSSAAATTQAEKKAVMGLVGGMARLGAGKWGIAWRVISLIGAGLTIYTVGSAAYDAFFGEDTPKDDCTVGTICRKYNSDGTYEVRTTTIEYASSQSSWSLSGGGFWYPYKNTYVSAVAPAKGYYRVHWVWRHKDAGKAVEDFDPATDLYPFTKGVGLTDLQEKLRNKGKLDQALTRQDIAAIVDVAVAGAIASDPTDWPADWTSSATPPKMETAGLSQAADDLFNQAVGSLFDPWTDGDADLVDPDEVADYATDDIADDGTPLPGTGGGTPTPTPTPTPGTGGGSSGGCLPGDAACPTNVNWGDPPAEPTLEAMWPSWFPSPFVAPDLQGSCTQFQMDAGFLARAARMAGSKFDAGYCQFMPQLKAVTKPLSTLLWTVAAGVILLRR